LLATTADPVRDKFPFHAHYSALSIVELRMRVNGTTSGDGEAARFIVGGSRDGGVERASWSLLAA